MELVYFVVLKKPLTFGAEVATLARVIGNLGIQLRNALLLSRVAVGFLLFTSSDPRRPQTESKTYERQTDYYIRHHAPRWRAMPRRIDELARKARSGPPTRPFAGGCDRGRVSGD